MKVVWLFPRPTLLVNCNITSLHANDMKLKINSINLPIYILSNLNLGIYLFMGLHFLPPLTIVVTHPLVVVENVKFLKLMKIYIFVYDNMWRKSPCLKLTYGIDDKHDSKKGKKTFKKNENMYVCCFILVENVVRKLVTRMLLNGSPTFNWRLFVAQP